MNLFRWRMQVRAGRKLPIRNKVGVMWLTRLIWHWFHGDKAAYLWRGSSGKGFIGRTSVPDRGLTVDAAECLGKGGQGRLLVPQLVHRVASDWGWPFDHGEWLGKMLPRTGRSLRAPAEADEQEIFRDFGVCQRRGTPRMQSGQDGRGRVVWLEPEIASEEQSVLFAQLGDFLCDLQHQLLSPVCPATLACQYLNSISTDRKGRDTMNAVQAAEDVARWVTARCVRWRARRAAATAMRVSLADAMSVRVRLNSCS